MHEDLQLHIYAARHHGGLWWAYPPKQSSKTPKSERETLQISGVLVNFAMSIPPAQTQSPPAELQSLLIETFWQRFCIDVARICEDHIYICDVCEFLGTNYCFPKR